MPSSDILSVIFSFLPLTNRIELGVVSAEFVLPIKQSVATQTDIDILRKMRRAAFFNRHLDKVDWEAISDNWLLSTEFFRKHEDKVDWMKLSGNPSIPIDLLENHLNDLDWMYLSYNSVVPIEFFEKYYRVLKNKPGYFNEKTFWVCIFMTHAITPELFKKCGDLSTLCSSPYTNMEMLETYKKESKLDTICYKWMIENRMIPDDFFDRSKFSDSEWFNACLDRFPTSERLELHIEEFAEDEKESWCRICMNKNVPIDFLDRHTDKIQWNVLVTNRAIPGEFFDRHFDKFSSDKRIVRALAAHPKMYAEFFEKHARYVDWHVVLSNCKLSQDFLRRYYDFLDWGSISGNNSVPVEFLEEQLNKIDWHKLCLSQRNIFTRTLITYGGSDEDGEPRFNDMNYCVDEEATYPWPERS
jgi:hypothetical protein